ncbi:MAG TPA: glycosyltransferase [Opitutales bacterium]|nr:glycosyltransferase [Opitutales bacterium]
MKTPPLPAPRHVLMVETLPEGHHPMWVGLCAQAFAGLGAKISIAAPEPAVLRERAGPHLEKVAAEYLPLPAAAKGAASLTVAGELLTNLGADLCFCATMDNYMSDVLRRAALGMRPPEVLRGKLGGVYHRPRPLDPRQGGLGNAFKRRGFRKLHAGGWWNAVYFLDPEVAKAAPENFPGLHSGLLGCPHEWRELPPRETARQRLGVPNGAIALLHFGLGTKRKGLELTLNALERCEHPEKFFLLRAGKSPADSPTVARVREMEKAGRARLLDYFVSTADEEMLYSAADVVLLPYLAHYGAANLLPGAAAADKPVLASDYALVGQLVRENRLGWIFRDQDAADLARQLDALAALPSERWDDFKPGLAEFAAANTYAAFIRSVQKQYV